MDVLLTTEPIHSRDVEALAIELGLSFDYALPWTDGNRLLAWARGDVRLDMALDAASGAAMIVVNDPGGELTGRVTDALACETVDEAIERVRSAATPRERVRAVHRLATVFTATTLEVQPVLDAIGACLLDEEPLVRWAAARVLRFRSDRYTEQLLRTATERFEDLAPMHEQVLEACVAAEEGTLHDGPTDDWWELIRRAREGVENEQWRRVAKAMDALLESTATHEEGLMLRALAYEHLDEPWLALALLAAAQAEAELELCVATDDDDDLDDDEEFEDELDDDEEDEFDEDEFDDDEDADVGDDDVARKRALVAEITGHRPRLEAAFTASEEPEDPEAVAEALISWLVRWDYHTSARAAAARAVLDRLPSIAGLLALEAGSYDDDVELLRRAVDLVPDAPECRFALAQTLARTNAGAAATVYADTLAALEVPLEERSELAQRIAATRHGSDVLSRADVLEQLTRRAYDEERFDEAARLGDELVVLEPDSIFGWQVRSNARIFADRLEEAAETFAETLEALERIMSDEDSFTFGDDPRGQMRFNWSAVLAKLGRHDEALEQLRRAVRIDDKWGPEARTDDFFEGIWEDSTFQAVADGDPAALVLDEERQPGYLEALVRRCVGLSHMGRDETLDECERAIALGERLQRPDQVAKAHSVAARTLALDGMIDESLTHSQEAMDRLPEVPREHQAEILHTHGLVLHQADELDQAEAAYRRAQQVRAEVEGEDHPVLAKGYGDLARLASDRGDDLHDVAALIGQGLELLDRWISRKDVAHNDTWLEAEMDACILQVNRGHTLGQADDIDGAIAAMEEAADRIERAVGHGTTLSPSFLDNATGLARTLAQQASEAERAERARAVTIRLETAQLDGPPEEIAERLFWRRLRSLARRLRGHGVDDAAFAGVLGRALRGELGAEELSVVPELAGLPTEISSRLQRYPTLLTMIAMSLSLVESGGSSLDEALENLEELCVGSLYTEGPLAPQQEDE